MEESCSSERHKNSNEKTLSDQAFPNHNKVWRLWVDQSEPLGFCYLNWYQCCASLTKGDISLGHEGSLTQLLSAIYPSIVLLHFKQRAGLRATHAYLGHPYHSDLALA